MDRKREQSAAWLARSERVIPGGAQTFSKSPRSFVQGVAPNFLARAQGAFVWDVDGYRYLDYIMGLGAVILGHGDADVLEAARTQMEAGISFSLPHPVEVEVAERLVRLIPCAEMVRFAKNGSDVTTAAVRLARAFTRREKILCCGYHGWHDWYIGTTDRNRGVPEAVRHLTFRFPYNDLDALHRLFNEHRGEIAAVIMEPVTFDPPAPGYLEEVRALCHRHGALLIFDEVITGFRFGLGGAQAYFGVVPDLACFGKAMANGFPLAALVGRADIMHLLSEPDVFFSTTHGGEAVSLAASRATLEKLEREDGIASLWRLGARLKEGINALLGEHRLADLIECVGMPPFTALRFHVRDEEEQLALRSLFQQEALVRGILAFGYHMLSLAHSEADIEWTLEQYAEIFAVIADAVRQGDVAARLKGPPIRPILRQA
ncbi:MAG: aminotransferase class III-fold pyridoxal phosphate-dependent enzyme [Blastocatellia bacterium]|nr:aminotransferase class III-fold pyridoxal phosphate-dependent enzyme [Blastocatellia bacterium]MCS7158593.1 aminotransferase class III-fold pyridoxal phosphate-dependent enzyme [Blastocatellia bacterium]MDW8169281.1 aminotransferase class III-fold pyridoxal phosphate-dependent enzyme [Acidobacteriota bacterium]MDW8257789.1 aminotransferase class III-fold pyridoxal phosphate-dependent enzyme [Acidobacteriota bacterium]